MRQGLKYKRHHAFVIVRLNKMLKLKLSIDITKIVVKSYLFVIKKEFFDKVYGTIISSRRSEIKNLLIWMYNVYFMALKRLYKNEISIYMLSYRTDDIQRLALNA